VAEFVPGDDEPAAHRIIVLASEHGAIRTVGVEAQSIGMQRQGFAPMEDDVARELKGYWVLSIIRE